MTPQEEKAVADLQADILRRYHEELKRLGLFEAASRDEAPKIIISRLQRRCLRQYDAERDLILCPPAGPRP